MIYLKSCPKCHGDVAHEVVQNTTTLKCLQCGYTIEGKTKVTAK